MIKVFKASTAFKVFIVIRVFIVIKMFTVIKVFIVTKVFIVIKMFAVIKVFIVFIVFTVIKVIKVFIVIKLDLMIAGKGRGMSCHLASILAASGTCKKVKGKQKKKEGSKETEWLLKSQPQFRPTYLWIPSQSVHCI